MKHVIESVLLIAVAIAAIMFGSWLMMSAAHAEEQTALIDNGSGTYSVLVMLPGGIGADGFLVDTGSSFTVVPPDLIERLIMKGYAKSTGKHVSGVLANGEVARAPVFIVTGLRVAGCELPPVPIVVLGIKPILGMDMLNTMAPFTLDLHGNTLHLAGCPKVAEAQ